MIEFLRDAAVVAVGMIFGLPLALLFTEKMADWLNL